MRTALIAALLLVALPLFGGSEIAVTFDDLPVVFSGDPIARQQQITRDLVTALKSRKIPAIGFVNANKLLTGGAVDEERVALLRAWLDAGFELGNHTWSHPDLHRITVDEYKEEIAKGEAPLRDLLAARGKKLRYFRHPFLHTGRSAEVRAAVESFLAERGVRVAPVTIDNSEWIFAIAYNELVKRGDDGQRKRLVAEYLDYMSAKAAYYEGESVRLFGRPIRQVLLVHASAMNAEAFGALADRLRRDGHRFISLDRALQDDAYRSPDSWYGAGGISWIDRWAITRGVDKTFFAGEPRTPQWVLTLAGKESE